MVFFFSSFSFNSFAFIHNFNHERIRQNDLQGVAQQGHVYLKRFQQSVLFTIAFLNSIISIQRGQRHLDIEVDYIDGQSASAIT